MNKELIEKELNDCILEMNTAFLEIQQPRTDYMLKHFVVGQHDTKPQQYAQCVVELQIKYDNIRRALLTKKKIEKKIELLEKKNTELSLIEAALKRIDLEEQDRAMLGAWREFKCLYSIWQSFDKKYTREDLNNAQEEYWVKRLTRQANQDLLATGRVQVGNQEALQQIGLSAVPELDHVRHVEKRYLENGNVKTLIVVPTELKSEKLDCLQNVEFPSGMQIKIYNVFGRNIHDAYNDAAMTAVKDNADFMLTVEDDTFPPPDAFVKLYNRFKASDNKKSVWGAWYPKRTVTRQGTPIVIKSGKREHLEDDGNIHEVYTIPMGCTLFPTSIFLETNFPWFATTDNLTQDSFFSQKAREAGYTLLVDTSIKCKHVDRNTGKVHE